MGRHNKEQLFKRDPEELSIHTMRDYAWDIIRTGADNGYNPEHPHYDWSSDLGHFSLVAINYNASDAFYCLRAQDERLINSHLRYLIDKHNDHIVQIDEQANPIEIDDEPQQDQLVMDYLRSNPIVPEHTLSRSGLLNFQELAARTAIYDAINDGTIMIQVLAAYTDLSHQGRMLERHAIKKILRQGVEVDGQIYPYSLSEEDIHATLRRFIAIHRSHHPLPRALPPATDTNHQENS